MISNGIINVNKPSNMTSHDVVAIMRRTLGIRKIGHTGTLDPMATGVLPICVGKATRVMEYLDLDLKAYRCTLALGIETDTQDIWGKVLSEKDASYVTSSDIKRVLDGFIGIIEQVPPMYSALKVNGKKLYEYARAGEKVDIKSRRVFIKNLVIENINLDKEHPEITFTVWCTKGTYVRTLCYDIGRALSCGATLTSLERISSGVFTIEDAISLDEIRCMERSKIDELFLPIDYPLVHFGKVITEEEQGLAFANGWHLSMKDVEIERTPEFAEKAFYLPSRAEYKEAYNVYSKIGGKEVFLGTAFYSHKYNKLVADKVFYIRDGD